MPHCIHKERLTYVHTFTKPHCVILRREAKSLHDCDKDARVPSQSKYQTRQRPLLVKAVIPKRLFALPLRDDMHVQLLTLRVPVRVEGPDDPYSVGPGGPAHVDDRGVQPVEDGPAEDGQAHSLRDDHLQAGERVLLVARPGKKKIQVR